mgnify:CR=1 FL=1
MGRFDRVRAALEAGAPSHWVHYKLRWLLQGVGRSRPDPVVLRGRQLQVARRAPRFFRAGPHRQRAGWAAIIRRRDLTGRALASTLGRGGRPAPCDRAMSPVYEHLGLLRNLPSTYQQRRR